MVTVPIDQKKTSAALLVKWFIDNDMPMTKVETNCLQGTGWRLKINGFSKNMELEIEDEDIAVLYLLST